MWSYNFVAKLRKACCVRSAPPDLERPISLGSQLAAHRVKTATQRHEKQQSSLLGACVAAMCRDVSRLQLSLELLPPDLQQVVLDALIAGGQLTDSTVLLFKSAPIFELELNRYPGVTESWLPTFDAAQLIQIDVSGCSAVRLCAFARREHIFFRIHACLPRPSPRRTRSNLHRQM